MERRRMKGRGERKEEELIQGSQVRQRIDARGDSASTCRHEGQIPTKEKEIDNDKRKKKKKRKEVTLKQREVVLVEEKTEITVQLSDVGRVGRVVANNQRLPVEMRACENCKTTI